MRKIFFFISFSFLVAENGMAACGEERDVRAKPIVTFLAEDLHEAKGMLAELNSEIAQLQKEEAGAFNPRILVIADKARDWRRGAEKSNEALWRVAHRISAKMMTYAVNAINYLPKDQHAHILQLGKVLGSPEDRGPADLDNQSLLKSIFGNPEEESKEDA